MLEREDPAPVGEAGELPRERAALELRRILVLAVA